MTIVIASDKFKGTLSAAGVAEALAEGIARVDPVSDIARVPVADGGDGTLAAALAAGYERCPVVATGPTGESVDTAYARSGETAVVELADVSGLQRLPDGPSSQSALTASTLGTGEVIRAAVDAGCRHVVLGVGGSASTDGGMGMVTALGARIDEVSGRIDLDELRDRLDGVSISLASDVDNPLLGPKGAAAIYGPQKGATAADVAELDARMARWADLVATGTGTDLRDHPGAGAAGGTGFGALALCGATMRSGVETVLEIVGFDDAVTGADLVITGEGSLDEQTLHGKAPVGVAAAAHRHGVPVVAVCGRTTLSPAQLSDAGFAQTFALADVDPERCFTDPATMLADVGEQIASRPAVSG